MIERTLLVRHFICNIVHFIPMQIDSTIWRVNVLEKKNQFKYILIGIQRILQECSCVIEFIKRVGEKDKM